MSLETIRSSRIKVGLSIFWVFFTFSLVLWWWVFSIYQTQNANSVEGLQNIHRMFFWEGLILLPVLFLGGVALVYLSFKDYRRHQQLRLFFNNFSHDIKTSITRLRLQTEILQEDENHRNHPAFIRLIEDLTRLDLQLENSLFLAKSDEQKFWFEKTRLSDLVSSVRTEWPELEIRLEKDALMEVDRPAFKSILRNLFQNSLQHGQATRINIQVEATNKDLVNIIVADDGRGLTSPIRDLGAQMIHSTGDHGNGVGLYLSKRLIEKMHGNLEIVKEVGQGFSVRLGIPGKLEAHR